MLYIKDRPVFFSQLKSDSCVHFLPRQKLNSCDWGRGAADHTWTNRMKSISCRRYLSAQCGEVVLRPAGIFRRCAHYFPRLLLCCWPWQGGRHRTELKAENFLKLPSKCPAAWPLSAASRLSGCFYGELPAEASFGGDSPVAAAESASVVTDAQEVELQTNLRLLNLTTLKKMRPFRQAWNYRRLLFSVSFMSKCLSKKKVNGTSTKGIKDLCENDFTRTFIILVFRFYKKNKKKNPFSVAQVAPTCPDIWKSYFKYVLI